MTGRCLIGQTRLPTRQQRRISNLVPHAGVISSPKASSGTVRKIGPHGASPIRNPGAMPWGVALLPAGAPGGRVERGSATASFIHLGRRPCQNAAQHIAQLFCSVAPSVFGSAHKQQHEGSDVQKVAKFGQRFAKGLQSVCGR